jgi:hypothetical protein
MNMLAKAIAQLRGEVPAEEPVKPKAPSGPVLKPALWVYESGGEKRYTEMVVEYDNGTWALVYINQDKRPFVVESSKLSYQP